MKKTILALVLGILWVPAGHAQYENTFTGALTGTYITTGSYNTYDGWNVGIFNKAGSYNTAVGHQSLYGNGGVYRADYNTAVGGQTGANIKDGANYNTMLGYRAGYTLTVGTNNVLIGQNAVTPSSTTSNYMNIAGLIRGDLKLSSVTVRGKLYSDTYYGDGSHLTGISTTTPAETDPVFMARVADGITAHHYEIGGSTVISSPAYGSTCIGRGACSGGYGNNSIVVGDGAGAFGVGGQNSFFGFQSGLTHSGGGGINNTFLGFQAGKWNASGGANTFVGSLAGQNSTGDYNTIIGAVAGASLTGGDRNIIINGDVPATPISDYLNIGNLIAGNLAGSSVTVRGKLWADSYNFNDGQTMIDNLGRIIIGTNTAVGGSNAGIQYSDARTNRGQIRMNQFGNAGGIAGITGFKSRGADTATLASVNAGDVLVRMTGIGVTGNNTNVPLSGLFSLVVATSGPLATQVPSYWEWNATDFNGVSGIVMNTTPDGSLVVKSSVSAPRFYGDGSGLTGVTATGLGYPFSTSNSSFTVGHIDAFGRHDIWFTAPSAFLRLGASAIDGDPMDSDSEGLAVFKPSVNRQLTLQSEDTRLSEADWTKYFWMVSPDAMAVSAYDHTKDLFSVTTASSQTYVNGELRYTDGSEGAGKVLTSDANGVASWQTGGGGGPSLDSTNTWTAGQIITSTAGLQVGKVKIVYPDVGGFSAPIIQVINDGFAGVGVIAISTATSVTDVGASSLNLQSFQATGDYRLIAEDKVNKRYFHSGINPGAGGAYATGGTTIGYAHFPNWFIDSVRDSFVANDIASGFGVGVGGVTGGYKFEVAGKSYFRGDVVSTGTITASTVTVNLPSGSKLSTGEGLTAYSADGMFLSVPYDRPLGGLLAGTTDSTILGGMFVLPSNNNGVIAFTDSVVGSLASMEINGSGNGPQLKLDGGTGSGGYVGLVTTNDMILRPESSYKVRLEGDVVSTGTVTAQGFTADYGVLGSVNTTLAGGVFPIVAINSPNAYDGGVFLAQSTGSERQAFMGVLPVGFTPQAVGPSLILADTDTYRQVILSVGGGGSAFANLPFFQITKTSFSISGSTLTIADGTEGAGKVLTSDALGQATWQTPVSSASVTMLFSTHTTSVIMAHGLASTPSQFTATLTCLISTDGYIVNDEIELPSASNGTWSLWKNNTQVGIATSFNGGAGMGLIYYATKDIPGFAQLRNRDGYWGLKFRVWK